MSLDSRLRWCALAALAACSDAVPPDDLVGTSVEALAALPALPTGGTATYRYTNIAADGVTDGPWDNALTISGTGATRTLVYNVLGNNVTRSVRSDGRQPDTDSELQANARVFGTLPPAGTPAQLGATWTINLPAALQQRLTTQVASGVSSTRPVFSGQFIGFVDLASPAGFSIARAVVKVKNWSARPAGIAGANGVQPGLQAIGVVDLLVSTSGGFVGMLPLRAAYFSDPAVMLADGANWMTVQASPHMTDLYCLVSEPGVPASLIAAVPTISGAPFPTVFNNCTH